MTENTESTPDSEHQTSVLNRRSLLRAGAIASLTLSTGPALASAHDQGERPEAAIIIPDQVLEDDQAHIHISQFYTSQPSYISLHDKSRFSGGETAGYDIPERENPICASIIGLSELLSAGKHTDVDVPVYNEFAPAVGEYGHHPEQAMQESQPIIAIPHINSTDPGEFPCVEDPPADLPPTDGPRTVKSMGAVNDIATVIVADDSEQSKQEARHLTRDIRGGRVTPP